MSAGTRLILVEGLPGSGKTSLAGWLCGHIERHGTSARWIPELRRDHPVIDRPTLRAAREPGHAARCVARWRAFARCVQALEAPRLFVLEGCLFQGTVRFLVEYEREQREIDAYLPAVEASLAPLRPRLVYLTQPDAPGYLASELDRRKGREVVARIARYSATTPWAARRRLSGRAALVSLYARYREVCDALVRRSGMPVLELDAVGSSEAAVRARAGAWIVDALRGPVA